MNTPLKKSNCCQGCKNGQPGQNETCKAKLMLENIEKNKIAKNK